ncbi:MAG: hypothetical protein H6557_21765 [Lewinellaceae bacterium]|nr:hypothetical protein [Lewinellaceae bacterium]
MKSSVRLWVAFLFAWLINIPSIAQATNSAYTIQENDWLSKIAQKTYDNPHLYYRIIEGTNRKAKSDHSKRGTWKSMAVPTALLLNICWKRIQRKA